MQINDESLNDRDLTFLLADAHALVREGLKHVIWRKRPHIRFVEFSNAISLMKGYSIAPEASLALVDISMPGMVRGAGLTRIARALPGIPMVIVASIEDPALVQRSRSIPAVRSIVTKNSSAEQLHVAIDAALAGDRLMLAVPPNSALKPKAGFTPRMIEVHTLLCQGMGNRSIADALNISEGTVKNYMSEIFRALGVSNRTQAAGCLAWAISPAHSHPRETEALEI
jgi:DNA-binding NarL/FixJ family response regulator